LEWAIGILENGKAGTDRPSLNSPPVRGN
jgi:hypothetical protein